jgi:hypothetical protein
MLLSPTPVAGRAVRCIPDALLPSVALERVTIKRFMLALVVAAAAVPRSDSDSPVGFVIAASLDPG